MTRHDSSRASLGRERLLTMTMTSFEPNRLVTYTSTQPGLPDASHERHFESDGAGFIYRLVVEYEPRWRDRRSLRSLPARAGSAASLPTDIRGLGAAACAFRGRGGQSSASELIVVARTLFATKGSSCEPPLGDEPMRRPRRRPPRPLQYPVLPCQRCREERILPGHERSEWSLNFSSHAPAELALTSRSSDGSPTDQARPSYLTPGGDLLGDVIRVSGRCPGSVRRKRSRGT